MVVRSLIPLCNPGFESHLLYSALVSKLKVPETIVKPPHILLLEVICQQTLLIVLVVVLFFHYALFLKKKRNVLHAYMHIHVRNMSLSAVI